MYGMITEAIRTLVTREAGEEAWEHYEFNIQGSYMGEHSPVFLTYKMGDEHE